MTNYIFESDIDKKRANDLTQDQIVKLKLYRLHLVEKRTCEKERMTLIIFMIENDLHSGLLHYV